MFVLHVVSKDKKSKCRQIKTKKQVRTKYRVKENAKNIPLERQIFHTHPDRADNFKFTYLHFLSSFVQKQQVSEVGLVTLIHP